MKAREYPAIWNGLTEKSKTTIAVEVLKAVKAPENGGYSIERVSIDFAQGGPLARSYWNAFLDNFSPETVLEQSTWEVGTVRKGTAEISIHFSKAERPAWLKMFKEGTRWKVGLVETFWGRR
jgi:hypothetical protein